MTRTKSHTFVVAIAMAIAFGLTTSASHAFNPQPDPPAKGTKLTSVINPALQSGLSAARLGAHVGLSHSVSRVR